MPNYNKVIIVGHLTKDPELSYTQDQKPMCKCGIASTNYKDKTCFVDIVIFGKQAETFKQYMEKGSACLVEGELQLDQWTTKDGEKRSKHGIFVHSFKFVGAKREGQKSAGDQHDERGGEKEHDIPF